VGYDLLLDTWQRACKAVGQRDNRLYDLRHCTGQWATDAGMSDAKVGTALRHKTADQTRRYTRTKNKGEVAATLQLAMFGPETAPEAASGDQ
jgi:integrase